MEMCWHKKLSWENGKILDKHLVVLTLIWCIRDLTKWFKQMKQIIKIQKERERERRNEKHEQKSIQ